MDALHPAREIALGLFVIFMIALFVLTFQNGQEWMRAKSFTQAIERWNSGIGVNKVPFRTIHNYIRYVSNAEYLWVNLAGNVLLFIPWGMCLPMFWKKFQSFLRMSFMLFMLPVTIEFCQLFLGRSVDIDDVILNFAGGFLGAVLYLVVRKRSDFIRSLAK